MALVLLCLAYFTEHNVLISIHVVANGRICFFLMHLLNFKLFKSIIHIKLKSKITKSINYTELFIWKINLT